MYIFIRGASGCEARNITRSMGTFPRPTMRQNMKIMEREREGEKEREREKKEREKRANLDRRMRMANKLKENI